MNKGTYGYPLPPNTPTRVIPPEWRRSKLYLVPGTYTDFIVPQNVFQIRAVVIPGGGSGAAVAGTTAGTNCCATGGSSGPFAEVVIDVVPGQPLPAITVGAGGLAVTTGAVTAGAVGVAGNAGGSSSIGTLVTCPGGSGGAYTATNGVSLPAVAGGVVSTQCRVLSSNNGGASGAITIGNATITATFATGGSSVLGGDSGSISISATTTGTGGNAAATGGASALPSGSITFTGNIAAQAATGGASIASASQTFSIAANSAVAGGGAGTLPFPAGSTALRGGDGYGVAGATSTAGAASTLDTMIFTDFLDRVLGKKLFSSGGSGSALSTADGLAGGPYGGAGGAFAYPLSANATRAAGNGGIAAGGGAAAASCSTGTCTITGSNGGVFGGGGAVACNGFSGTVTFTATAGAGGTGAGGGAAVAKHSSGTATATSGPGGNGMVALFWTEGY